MIFAILPGLQLHARNPRRPQDFTTPVIRVSSTDPEYAKTWASLKSSFRPNKTEYKLKSRYLRLRPLLGFNLDFFKKNYLPQSTIEFRNGNGSVSGAVLSQLANELLEEIKVGQTKFTRFSILKDKDFNYKTLSGLLIVKYNDYPFVLKISIEHPHTMIEPYTKNIEADGLFICGGTLRHLSNFTRIQNLQRIRNILNYNPFYLKSLDYPRKWYWKPEQIHDLKVVWQCNKQEKTIMLPSVYATISDFIITQEHQPQADLNRLSMKVASDTGFLIDPHAGNIVIEQGSHRYVLLDTEDFRMMVGLDCSMRAKKYIGWYIELIGNSIQILAFRTKQQRLSDSCSV